MEQIAPKLTGLIERFAMVAGGVAVLALMLMVSVNAVSRLVFDFTFSGSVDYVRYWLMPAVVAFGLGLAEHRDQHLRVDLMAGAWRGRARQSMELLVAIISAAFLTMVIVIGWPHVVEQMNLNETAPGASIRIWPARWLLTGGLIAFLFVLVFKAWSAARGRNVWREEVELL